MKDEMFVLMAVALIPVWVLYLYIWEPCPKEFLISEGVLVIALGIILVCWAIFGRTL